MKTILAWKRVATIGLAGCAVAWAAQPATEVEPPVPLSHQPARTSAPTVATPSGQQLYRPGQTLIPAEQAQGVVDRFREAYEALGRPRLVIAVNRELVDTSDQLRITKRNENVSETTSSTASTYPAAPAGSAPSTQVNVSVGGSQSTGSTSQPTGPGESKATYRTVTSNNTYAAGEKPTVTLADRQTVRDVERLFGRPLRIGGAQLADQRVVASLLESRPLDDVLVGASENARRDRAALSKSADAVLEVLISSRSITLPGFNGSEVRTVPDIQATLIRLSDGAILGQASATDVLGKDRNAGPVVRNYDVRDIAEATALALMEDVAVTAPRPSS